MLKKIKTLILTFSLLIVPAVPLAATAIASAEVTSDVTGALCKGAETLRIDDTGAKTCGIGGDQTAVFNSLLAKIINIISIIVGVIAVIMIIVGGFRYIASGGKQESVTGAKNTILYALIGLIIVALAQVIVRFVLKKTTAGDTT